MRYAPSFALVVAAALAVCRAHALERPDTARELKQLQAQHDKEAAAALEPVHKRYTAALEQLLRRAAQINDADTMKSVRTELEKFGVTAGAVGNPLLGQSDETRKNTLRAHLRDTQWHLAGQKTFDLKADGTTKASWHGTKGTWKVIGPNLVELVISHAREVQRATFDDDLTTATLTGEKGGPADVATRKDTGR
jgi:hypothetical protein